MIRPVAHERIHRRSRNTCTPQTASKQMAVNIQRQVIGYLQVVRQSFLPNTLRLKIKRQKEK